jgi:hypothetical protein
MPPLNDGWTSKRIDGYGVVNIWRNYGEDPNKYLVNANGLTGVSIRQVLDRIDEMLAERYPNSTEEERVEALTKYIEVWRLGL